MPKGKGHEGTHLPLDPNEDFSNPLAVPGSEADGLVGHNEPEEQSSEEIEEIVQDIAEGTTEQLELPGAQADVPKVIRNGKMLAQFVKPHFEKEEGGDRYVGFEISLPLTPEHEENGHLPNEVIKEWQHFRNGNVKRTEIRAIAAQTITIALVPDNNPDDHEMEITLTAAAVKKLILAAVMEKGSGISREVVRLSFRAIVEQTPNLANFAVNHHGDPVWFSMQRTQGSLLED